MRLYEHMTVHGCASCDDALEAAQVDLAQRPLVDVGRDAHAVGLLVVGREVLERGADALDCRPRTSAAPSTPDTIGSSERYSKLRPHSGERLMLMPGPSSTPTPSAARLLAERRADALEQLGVERRAERHGRREARRGHAVAEAEVVAARALLAHAVRTVGQHDRRDAGALDGLGGPEARRRS